MENLRPGYLTGYTSVSQRSHNEEAKPGIQSQTSTAHQTTDIIKISLTRSRYAIINLANGTNWK